MIIRKAQICDLEQLLEIYNYEVENGVATFDTDKRTLDEWRDWYNEHNKDNHPLLVAEIDGVCVGYATLSGFSARKAYDATVELSVYVSVNSRKTGVATALMNSILEFARNDKNTHLVVSIITGENQVSKKIHKSFGFELCGTIREAGYKFGRYLDVDYYRLEV